MKVMRNQSRYKCSLLITVLVAVSNPGIALADGSVAKRIIEASGVRGGLVVHVGCKDGEQTAALRVNDSYVVQGLDIDAKNIRKANASCLTGAVSFMHWDGKTLPYVNNLVNLLVADCSLENMQQELLRALSPGGVAVIRKDANIQLLSHFSKQLQSVDDQYAMLKKPRSSKIDDWTHWMHDASGNGVAMDQVVGPPRHFQWIARPYWSKHHDTVLTTSAMVSAKGRVFYICNEAQPASIFSDVFDGKWFLVARDAFSGVLLWKRPITDWGWQSWGETFHQRFAQPPQLPSRLVAVGDTVYATLGFHHRVEAIDAATGNTIRTYGLDYVDEILVHNGSLVASRIWVFGRSKAN